MKFLPKLLLLVLLAFPATVLIKGESPIPPLNVAKRMRQRFTGRCASNASVS